MSTNASYPNWKAANTALSAAVQSAARDSGQSQSDLMKMAYLDRLLCRIFDQQAGDDWVLKGGTGMLSRVPNSRTTKDIDITTAGGDVDAAEKSLTTLVSRDIGDHVFFELEASNDSIDAALHPGISGRRLFYRMRDTHTRKPLIRIPVDMTVEAAPISGVDVFDPRNRILPKNGLPTVPYRLYPVPDQIADKVIATMQSYGPDRHSTRVKDLVDLVVIARTQTVNLDKLNTALNTRLLAHHAPEFQTFAPPQEWKSDYPTMAKGVPAVGPFHNFDAATTLVCKLVDPALAKSSTTSLTWHPDNGWKQTAPSMYNPSDPNSTTSVPPPAPSCGHDELARD